MRLLGNPARWVVIVFLVSCSLLSGGCSVTERAIGYHVEKDEVYRGTVTINMDGTGTITVIGDKSGTRADGLATWRWGMGNPHGGVLTINTQDGRRVSGEWVGTTTTSGYGSAIDQFGQRYLISFGLDKTEEQAWVASQRRNAEAAAKVTPQEDTMEPYWASEFHDDETSKSELLFREWQIKLGEETFNAMQRGFTDPNDIAQRALNAASAHEAKLRKMLIHEGVAPNRADTFIESYKNRLPRDITWLQNSRKIS